MDEKSKTTRLSRRCAVLEAALDALINGDAPFPPTHLEILTALRSRFGLNRSPDTPEDEWQTGTKTAFHVLEAGLMEEEAKLEQWEKQEVANELSYLLGWSTRLSEGDLADPDKLVEVNAGIQKLILQLLAHVTENPSEATDSDAPAPSQEAYIEALENMLEGQDETSTDEQGENPGSQPPSPPLEADEISAPNDTAQKGPGLPGLLGLRLLLIVLKSMLRVKEGGLGMNFNAQSQAEIQRFMDSIQQEIDQKSKQLDGEFLAALILTKAMLGKQLSDLGVFGHSYEGEFHQANLAKMKKYCDAAVDYGREYRKGYDLPQKESWDEDDFEAGPFLVDAFGIGLELKEKTDSRRKELEQEAKAVITKHVRRAAGVGVVPIPIVDLIGLGVVNRALVKELADLYGVPFNEVKVKGLVRNLLWDVGAIALGGRVLGSLGKMIPGIGTLAGVAASSITSGAITYAIGNIFQDYFEEGFSIKDILPEDARKRMKVKYKEGLDVVKGLVE